MKYAVTRDFAFSSRRVDGIYAICDTMEDANGKYNSFMASGKCYESNGNFHPAIHEVTPEMEDTWMRAFSDPLGRGEEYVRGVMGIYGYWPVNDCQFWNLVNTRRVR